jgi:Putative phage tail protein
MAQKAKEPLMATIIFSSLGRALGGNVGQVVGAIIGQRIDQKLFGPKGRQGPRLGELAVQSSTYGAPIPKLYGANRVAGSVIWSTDLRENKKKVSNGKGQPKTTVYSYSASFAVALSARPVGRIGRIWADGKLLRGAAGDFKTQTGFRLYSGSEDQAVDPLIASAEGIANTPAYRGLAYAVFENMQLGDYGNRIPSLSFEVFAEEGTVSAGAILADIAGSNVAATVPTALSGFAAYGDSVRGVAETLLAAIDFSAVDDGHRLSLASDRALAPAVTTLDLGSSSKGERLAKLAIERASASTVPEVLTIAHYEPSRDYQQGLQRARRDGGARREARIDLPIVLTAEKAKALAEARLTKIWAERVQARIRVPWRRLDLTPGQRVIVAGNDAEWRIAGVTLEKMVVEAELVRLSQGSATLGPADPGRSLIQTDLIHGPTTFHLIDLPPIDDGLAAAPKLVVAAAGTSPGWRSAGLLVSTDGGMSWIEAGSTALPATIGSALTTLAQGSALLTDRARTVDVAMLHYGMTLSDADDAGIRAGRNLAILGDELLQFRSAAPLGAGQYRLSGLERGRRGTDWAMASHAAGERFVLIESDTLAAISVAAGVGDVRVIASGIADGPTPPQKSISQPGQAVLPLSPVHLIAERQSSGDTALRWVRRSRDGWRWVDGVDAPLGEESEKWRIEIMPSIGAVRLIETSAAACAYTLAMRSSDGASAATSATAQVYQIGAYGRSRAAAVTFSLT